jgi:LPS-assembly lipoprotein
MNRRFFLAALPAAVLGGCGFQLRRVDGVPFASVYVDAGEGAVAQRIRTLLKADKKTRVVATREEAEAIVKLTPEERTKTILSLSGAGRVTEYRLGLNVGYSVTSRDDQVLAAPETIELVRDLTYDDTQLLAKGAEEQLLYRDMEESAAWRILRRLQRLAS